MFHGQHLTGAKTNKKTIDKIKNLWYNKCVNRKKEVTNNDKQINNRTKNMHRNEYATIPRKN